MRNGLRAIGAIQIGRSPSIPSYGTQVIDSERFNRHFLIVNGLSTRAD
jgi:hypothetical protein